MTWPHVHSINGVVKWGISYEVTTQNMGTNVVAGSCHAFSWMCGRCCQSLEYAGAFQDFCVIQRLGSPDWGFQLEVHYVFPQLGALISWSRLPAMVAQEAKLVTFCCEGSLEWGSPCTSSVAQWDLMLHLTIGWHGRKHNFWDPGLDPIMHLMSPERFRSHNALWPLRDLMSLRGHRPTKSKICSISFHKQRT